MREEAARPIIEEQRAALLSGDLARFLATFVLEGHDEPALTVWFSGYATDPAPTAVAAAIEEMTGNGDDGMLRVAFTFSWPGFDDLTEHTGYEVSWRETGTARRVKRFWLKRDLPPWPDRPARRPIIFAPPGAAGGPISVRAPSRPQPGSHPSINAAAWGGAAAPSGAGEWPELGAVVCRLRVARAAGAGPRLEVVARDAPTLAAALPAAAAWLERAGAAPGGAHEWAGPVVSGAPGWDDWRRVREALAGATGEVPRLADDIRFEDPVPVRLLERTLNRVPRYREAHRELGSAAILAEMMSRTTARWAYRAAAADAAGVLDHLSRHFPRRVAAGENLPRPPGVPRSQRRPLPWGGLDEALAIRESHGESRAPCGTLGPVYAAVLRLSGHDPFTVYNVWMPVRIVTVIHLERAAYLVSNHSVVVMRPRTRYWSRAIHRLSADAWFWDGPGATDAPLEAIARHREDLARQLPTFTIPAAATPAGEPATDFWRSSTAEYHSPAALAAAARRYVEAESVRRPASPYTWARYAFQTLRVAHPQVYLRCGMKSGEVDELAPSFSSRDDLLRWAAGLSRRSIFPERDRLMTPDQVIRYARGRPADIAGALAALCARRFGDRPLIHVGGGAAFLLLRGGDDPPARRRWLQVDDLTEVDAPRGPLVAAWDARFGWTRWSSGALPRSLVQDL